MKTITINRNSWHYRLISKFDGEWRAHRDFCCYLRGLIGALFLSVLLLSLALIVVASYGDFLAWIVFCVLNATIFWPWVYSLPALLATTLLCLALVIIATGTVADKMPADVREFASDAWESFHDKVCFRTIVSSD